MSAPHLVAVRRTSPTADRSALPATAPLPDLLKPADVAVRLNVSAGRVYQLLADGTIPCVRRGRSVRVPRLAYERWLTSLADEAEAAVRR